MGDGPDRVQHPGGQGVLSPLIDCYDGLPVAWTIGTSPNAELADGMLSGACSTLGEGDRPVIHLYFVKSVFRV